MRGPKARSRTSSPCAPDPHRLAGRPRRPADDPPARGPRGRTGAGRRGTLGPLTHTYVDNGPMGAPYTGSVNPAGGPASFFRPFLTGTFFDRGMTTSSRMTELV
jgi:hypothetical protein